MASNRDGKRMLAVDVGFTRGAHCASHMLLPSKRWGMNFRQCVNLCVSTKGCAYLTFVPRKAPGPRKVGSDCLLYATCKYAAPYNCNGCSPVTYALRAIQFPMKGVFCDYTPMLNIHRYGITTMECERKCKAHPRCRYFTSVPLNAPGPSQPSGTDCLHWAECFSLHDYHCHHCKAVTYAISDKKGLPTYSPTPMPWSPVPTTSPTWAPTFPLPLDQSGLDTQVLTLYSMNSPVLHYACTCAGSPQAIPEAD